MVQFQSTLEYVKNPPQGYVNEGVDIIAGLNDIDSKVNNGDYTNEYDFESDIAALLVKAHDGHLDFEGMAFGGVFSWRRSRDITLISGTIDGTEEPKIWALQDFNQTGEFERSAISKINGKDVVQFLEDESNMNAYHDPDTRFNAMLYLQAAMNLGLFANPNFYPGPDTNLTFENGTTKPYPNAALVLTADDWSDVDDPESFYRTFVQASTSSTRLLKRETKPTLPRHLYHPKEAGLGVALDNPSTAADYPTPVIQHSSATVPLAGYFVDTSAGTVGILMIQTFNVEVSEEAEEFQDVVEEYITEAKARNVVKIIIDVRTNGGGVVFLGYDTYLQFFPSEEPQLQSRYRAHEAANLFGSQISTLKMNSQTGRYYTSSFNYHSFLDQDLEAFSSWEDMYGPTTFHNDNFTNLLRYNLSDPLVTSSDRWGLGITMTGYGRRSNFTENPFSAEDIVILSDGLCASTCALFTELMVQQSGVKTLAIGGRPQLGPMQAVGGTKGSLVLYSKFLTEVASFVVSGASTLSEARSWASILPGYFGIKVQSASINMQDNIRKGLEKDGVPTQFLNDTASCRIWYERGDYLNVTNVWRRAAEVSFGGEGGGLDEKACVKGSVTNREQQQGVGEGQGSPTQPEGSANPTKSKGAAAFSYTHTAPSSGWAAILVCGAVVVSSMVFGASLI